MVKDLARKGFNICMVSRTRVKLNRLEAEIKRECPDIKTKVIVADFSDEKSLQWYHNLFDQVKDLDISIVIPNAGELFCGSLEEKG